MSCATLTEDRVDLRKQRPTLGERLMTGLEAIENRLDRQRQRRALMALDNHLLRDIGVSRGEALAEGSKPFWTD